MSVVLHQREALCVSSHIALGLHFTVLAASNLPSAPFFEREEMAELGALSARKLLGQAVKTIAALTNLADLEAFFQRLLAARLFARCGTSIDVRGGLPCVAVVH